MGRKGIKPYGAKGYIVYATNDIEIAYMSWKEKASLQKAFSTSECQAIIKDANSFMDTVLYTEVMQRPIWLPGKILGQEALKQFIKKIHLTLEKGTLEFKSFPIETFPIPKPYKIYNAMTHKIDWNKGYSTLYIGSRKKGFPRAKFLKRCKSHILLARKKLLLSGIKGYITFLTPDYYVSFANWKSKKLVTKEFNSEHSKVVIADGKEFLENVLWNDAREIPKDYYQKLKNALNRLFKK